MNINKHELSKIIIYIYLHSSGVHSQLEQYMFLEPILERSLVALMLYHAYDLPSTMRKKAKHDIWFI